MIKVGINGFGRIGRMVFRAAVQNFASDIQIVGINDLLDPDYLAYMLKYDSVHGRFKGDVKIDGNTMIVNGNKIRLTAEKEPANLKWNEVGADVVVESTGFFLSDELARAHITAGAKSRVVGSLKRRHPDVCIRRKPQNLQRSGHHFQRFLHDQLSCPLGKSTARRVRH